MQTVYNQYSRRNSNVTGQQRSPNARLCFSETTWCESCDPVFHSVLHLVFNVITQPEQHKNFTYAISKILQMLVKRGTVYLSRQVAVSSPCHTKLYSVYPPAKLKFRRRWTSIRLPPIHSQHRSYIVLYKCLCPRALMGGRRMKV